MRRRSTRSSTKVSPEKPIDSPSNKPRLRSRRRRSSSRSSSEGPTPKRVLRNSANKNDRKSPENEKKEDNNENIESPVSRKQENRKRTSNNHDGIDEVKELKAREISSKPDHSEEVSVKTEEKEGIEGKGLKGKSRGKNKSKSDNSPQISESESHTQSEISENTQVTSQSPTHTSVNIPSDNVPVSPDEINNPNIENVSKESDIENKSEIVKTETVTESVEIVKSEEDTNDCLQAHDELKMETCKIDKEEETPQSTMELQCSTDKEIVETNTIKEELGEQAETNQNAINTMATDLEEIKEVKEETLEMETEKISPTPHNTSVTEEKKIIVEESLKDETFEVPEPQNISQVDTSLEKDSIFNVTDSCKEDVEKLVETNEEIQNMKSQVLEIFHTPEPKIRKRRWGNSVVSLHLMKSSLSKIDVNTIKSLCLNVEFLEENEVKLEIKERRKSLPESKDKKMERKVSLDYKIDGDYSQFQRQTSTTSIEDNNESDNSHIIAMNRKISIVDDTASKLRPPPSPAKNPISSVLYITNLVRPFTLKQLKDLLERTGKIKENGFWTDKVKSKCYVHYETEEEAEATRNALHGVNWPVGNAKQLCIEYATEEDLETARNPPPVAAPPVECTNIVEKENEIPAKHTRDDKPKEREKARNNVREWDLEKQNKRRSLSREREERDRRRHRRSATPIDSIKRKQLKEEEEIPQKRMDDLFRKTKASPSIYWLPLTPEEIAIKEQQRLQRMAEHKRRMEESSRSGRADYGRGAAYRRRY